ncbi:PREDICTED: uncharacterized protein LOC109469882 [Branchiostoma belcheri]|uniref:Uncharacterized protein LOC109469882 n=1 Tax=Branchiostoma belcheri TaxID=7741 RepID=A0A6P4YIG5_BRABE|nr:PREDICTED: uncharacterized protein LOC109469882 [Branchiostoma belcheri]
MMDGIAGNIRNLLFRSGNRDALSRCKEGDLLQFHRAGYSDWGVYAGHGRVIHCTKDDDSEVKVEVREDDFWDVEENDRVTINNGFDKNKDALPGWQVVERARSKLGLTGFKNSEHFVHWCRYNWGFSGQTEFLSQKKNFLFRERNQDVLSRCKEGDLLQFHRAGYSDWGVYAGHGRVIHCTKDDDSEVKVEVREDDFWDVEENDRVTINNGFDKNKDALPGWQVVERARSKLGLTGDNVPFKNSEHFVHWCRYNWGFSGQTKFLSQKKNFLFRERNQDVLSSCKEGDLLEFHRLGYAHWAVYVGNGRVIHRTEDKGGKAGVMVREDDFWDVEENDRVTINNGMDKITDPLPGGKVVKRARSKLGETGYNMMFKNCEHFVRWCRYGVKFSGQAMAAGSVIGGLIAFGAVMANPVLAGAGAFIGAMMAGMNKGSKKFLH